MNQPITAVTAIYAGTFDPLTLGHEDLVRRGARLFSEVVVAVAAAHHKTTLFSQAERVEMARDALADQPRVRVLGFDGLLRDLVRAQGAQVVLRGVRSATDFDYETQLAGMNRQLMPDVDTVFMWPSDGVQYISSTLVREIARLSDDAHRFVSPTVHARLARALAERRR